MISGGGTTLKNLIDRYDHGELNAQITQVISNKPNAGGLHYAADAGIDCEIVDHREFDSVEAFSQAIFDAARTAGVDLVVMGGFLRRVAIPKDFVNRVINIHPSLIPAFCGKSPPSGGGLWLSSFRLYGSLRRRSIRPRPDHCSEHCRSENGRFCGVAGGASFRSRMRVVPTSDQRDRWRES